MNDVNKTKSKPKGKPPKITKTQFDHNGKQYKIETRNEWLKLYECQGGKFVFIGASRVKNDFYDYLKSENKTLNAITYKE
jgi:hypothetical protein